MKEKKVVFRVVKDDKQKLVQFIKRLPVWKWFDAYITYPKSQAGFRNIAASVGYVVADKYGSRPMVANTCEVTDFWDPEVRTDFIKMLVQGKLPSFIQFDLAGYGNPGSFVNSKELVAEFIGRGYEGQITFQKWDHDFCRDASPATCYIKVEEDGSALIEISWDEEHGGKGSDIAPILELFYSLGFNKVEGPMPVFT